MTQGDSGGGLVLHAPRRRGGKETGMEYLLLSVLAAGNDSVHGSINRLFY